MLRPAVSDAANEYVVFFIYEGECAEATAYNAVSDAANEYVYFFLDERMC